MRDILTALAGLVILVLTAALVAPPLIDWDARRGDVERSLTGAVGAPIETAGEISVRLLPSPRLTVDWLRVGGGPGEARLSASGVVAQIELAPLLRGVVRFSSGVAQTAELRIPLDEAGALRLPSALAPGTTQTRTLAFDDLRTERLDILAERAGAQAHALAALDDVRLSASALLGPYRIDGRWGALPVSIATGRIAPDGTAQVRFLAGQDTPTRLEADATLALVPTADGSYTASLAGEARAVLAPAALAGASAASADDTPPAPLSVRAGFATQPGAVALPEIVIEAGEAATGTRLEGEGRLALDDPLLALDLRSRRVVLERLMEGPLGVLFEAARREATPLPVSLALSVDSLSLRDEEIGNVVLALSSGSGALVVDEARATLPGDARATFAGEIGLGDTPRIEGRASLVAADSARLGRFLGRLGFEGPLLGLLDGQPLDVSTSLAWRSDMLALSNLRLAAGETALTGALRYDPGGPNVAPTLSAQIGADGLDLARLPRLAALADVSARADVSLVLDARDVRFEGAAGAGRIQAALQSQGDGIVVETLEITDLAGASASVSGRIEEDGTGRIEGRLRAIEAEPLIALVGRVAFGDAVGVIPAFIREGALDVALTVERFAEGNATGEPGLRTTIDGTAAGGPIEAQWLTLDGRTQRLEVTLSTQDTRAWLDVDDPLVAGRPSLITLTLGRTGPDRIGARLAADVAGLRLNTTRPLVLDAIDYAPLDGEIDLTTPDLRPALALLGGRVVAEEAVPAALRASVARTGVETTLQAGGAVAGRPVRADVVWALGSEPAATLRLQHLSLPWLVQALALGDVRDARSGLWSRRAFSALARPFASGTATIEADALDLGGGHVAGEARLDLALVRDGLAVTGLEGALADGRIAADFTLRRPSADAASIVGEVSLADVSLARIAPDLAVRGRLTGTLSFGGSGGNIAETVGALAGEGRLTLDDLVVPGADPGALRRGLERALLEDDPLGGRRIETYVVEALDEAPFRADMLEAPATLVSGVLTLSPIAVPSADAAGSFEGVAALDLRSITLDIRGFLRAEETPQGWEGPSPTIALAFAGPPGDLARSVDVGPLTNGIAAIVLQRELARIEAFEREASERQRRLDEARLLDRRRIRAQAWSEEVERRRLEEQRARGALEAGRRAAEGTSLEAWAAERARLEEEARQRAEEEARLLAEEEARRLADEEERRRVEASRRAAEEAERLRAEEERLRIELEARREAEAEPAAEARDAAPRPAAEALPLAPLNLPAPEDSFFAEDAPAPAALDGAALRRLLESQTLTPPEIRQ